MDAETKPEPKRRAPPIERAIEQTLFASRWLLAPIFVGLGAGLVVLLIKFVMSLWVLVNHLIASEGSAVILGVLDLGDFSVETPDVVAQRIRTALPFIAAERLIIAPDCGLKYLPRDVAFAKLRAMVEGAALVRRELTGSRD